MKNKHSILIAGIDEKNIYEIVFITQGFDGSFYYGLCDKSGRYTSMHVSGKIHMHLEKGKPPMKLGKGTPLSELKGVIQLQCMGFSVEAIKNSLNLKKYQHKKIDGIFTIDLRKFKKILRLSPFLIPSKNLSKINKILNIKWYKEGQFYLYTKTDPKLLIVAY